MKRIFGVALTLVAVALGGCSNAVDDRTRDDDSTRETNDALKPAPGGSQGCGDPPAPPPDECGGCPEGLVCQQCWFSHICMRPGQGAAC